MNSEPKHVYLSTAYFPPIEYFVRLAQSEVVWMESEETYPKQSYRNRCCILGPNGIQVLSVPVCKPDGNHTKTKDAVICHSDNWQTKHWRSISTAYGSSAFFLYYADEIHRLVFQQPSNLLQFNTVALETLCKIMALPVTIRITSHFERSYRHDCRNNIHPKKRSVLTLPNYFQVFGEKLGFTCNLSILDLLFNLGPEATDYLKRV